MTIEETDVDLSWVTFTEEEDETPCEITLDGEKCDRVAVYLLHGQCSCCLPPAVPICDPHRSEFDKHAERSIYYCRDHYGALTNHWYTPIKGN